MEPILFPSRGIVAFSMGVLFLLACAQVIHLVVIRRARGGALWHLMMVYEAMIVLHLLIGTFYMNALGHAWVPACIAFGPLLIPLRPLLWFNLLFFACGMALCIGARRAWMAPELLALLAMTPPVLDFAGVSSMVPIIVDAVIFAFAVSRRLLLDYERSYSSVMPSAVVTAMKSMPEGVLIADSSGRILFVNDAMRGLLALLGVRADLSGLSDVTNAVRDRASELMDDASMRVLICREDGSLEQAWHVISDEAMLGNTRCLRMFAIDITEESALEAELKRANAQLESTEAQLIETLEEVREAASDEALIRMRSRVHDVIGQRLSLLHRYLEDESIDDERLEKMKPMLKGIVSDLREDADVDWRIELESIVSAFSLVGVDVQVAGDLPEDLEVAIACTGIIREAVTNAVKHANASVVRVSFARDLDGFMMSIEDNGTPAGNAPMVEGQGIKGMRAVVARCAGILEIERLPSFTLTATFPTM